MSGRDPAEILDEALSRPEPERDAYLVSICAGDRALLADLRSLLAAYLARPELLQPGGIGRDLEAPAGEAPTDEVPTGQAQAGPAPVLEDRYRIIRSLGRGGMGEVLLAEDTLLARAVALKRLSPGAWSGDGARASLLREARRQGSIDHPGVATLFGFEVLGGEPYLVQAFVAGETLADRLRHGPLPLDEVNSIGAGILDALAAAHAAGVVHLDLKPANVMITREGGIRVIDFGIAAALDEPAGAGSGSGAGTPGYASPEQIGGEICSPSADIWSFGCLWYECLTGEQLIVSLPDEAEITGALARLPAGIPGTQAELLARCLRVEPELRPADGGRARALFVMAAARADGQPTSSSSTPSPARAAPESHPAAQPPLLGREVERERIRTALLSGGPVTITGAGGMGKSRLAMAIAGEVNAGHGLLSADRSGGALVVYLATRRHEHEVMPAVAEALGARERADETDTERLTRAIGDARRLLVLDNAEHIVGGVRETVAAIGSTSGDVAVITTSREPLGVRGERIIRLGGLGVTADEATPGRDPAGLVLFRERARAAGASWADAPSARDTMAEIVRRLEGIPLAIELAAARAASLSPADIRARLDDPGFLRIAPGVESPSQHRSLEAALDWSHRLLGPLEQQCFRCLSVIEGPFDLELGEAMLDPDDPAGDPTRVISDLVHRSLLEYHHDDGDGGAGSYRMLEPVRAYARNQLARSGQERAVRVRHARGMLDRAHALLPSIRGPRAAGTLDAMERDHHDHRAALRFLGDEHASPTDREVGVRLCAALGLFWQVRGHWREGLSFCETMLRFDVTIQERADVTVWAGNLALERGEFDRALEHYARAATLAESAGNDLQRARCLVNSGAAHILRGDHEAAIDALERGLAIHRGLGDSREIAVALINLGVVAERREDFVGARAYYEESLELRRQLGDARAVALSLTNLAAVAEKSDDLEYAGMCNQECLLIRRDLGDAAGVAESLHNLGVVRFRQGHREGAEEMLLESLRMRRELDDRARQAESLESLADLWLESDVPRAALGLALADGLRLLAGARLTAHRERRRERTLGGLEATADGRSALSRARLRLGARGESAVFEELLGS